MCLLIFMGCGLSHCCGLLCLSRELALCVNCVNYARFTDVSYIAYIVYMNIAIVYRNLQCYCDYDFAL